MQPNTIPDYEAIDRLIREAQVQRSIVVGDTLARFARAVVRGLKRLGATMSTGYAAELDRRAIEADAFLKRSVPHY